MSSEALLKVAMVWLALEVDVPKVSRAGGGGEERPPTRTTSSVSSPSDLERMTVAVGSAGGQRTEGAEATPSIRHCAVLHILPSRRLDHEHGDSSE